MKYLVTGKEMKLLDQNTSNHFHVPELVLMEQAAMHFVRKLSGILKEAKRGIVFCGLGNNGADGIAIARLLNEQGIHTEICRINGILKECGNTSQSYQVQESIYEKYQYPICDTMETAQKREYDFVIDAVFGIGLSRNLNQEYIEIIEQINQIDAVKAAVDMPSGINSDNGQIMGAAVKCDYTITFSFEKLGQYLWPGSGYAGKTLLAEIGITNRSWLEENPVMAYLEKTDLCLLPKRKAHSNKGTYGKLLIIAGSANMAGAAVFAAKAAYRCGTGLVKVFTTEENRIILQTAIPEALISVYGQNVQKEQLKEQLLKEMNWADAIVIGPGLGCTDVSKQLVEIVCSNSKVPVVWDADALNILAGNMQRLPLAHSGFIFTPHLGEFSRLTDTTVSWIQNHLVECAIDFARTYDVICVLKDFHTVTANPSGLSYLNLSGNNGMATGGSGDVLAGIIGAFLAQGQKAIDAAAFGIYIHGLAGDAAKQNTGMHGMIAGDIIEALKEIWKEIEYAEQ